MQKKSLISGKKLRNSKISSQKVSSTKLVKPATTVAHATRLTSVRSMAGPLNRTAAARHFN
jgi:hypothetical protein